MKDADRAFRASRTHVESPPGGRPKRRPPEARSKERARVFALPADGLYVTDSGSLQSRLLRGQTVSAWNPDRSPFRAGLELNVRGVKILGSSGQSSYPADLATALGLSQDLQNGLNMAAQAIGIISGAVGVVMALPAVLRIVGLLEDEPNPFNVLFEKIDQKLSAILAATLAGSKLSTKLNLRNLIGHAETSADIARKHIANGRPQDVSSLQLLGQADYFSRYAVKTMAGVEYWMRLYDELAIIGPGPYGSHWTWGVKERAAQVDGTVWDYRLTLPAYLKCLVARLAVIKALDPDHQTTGSYHEEIMGYAKFTRSVEARMRAGIARATFSPGPEQYPFLFKFQAQPCGVVDLHSGLNDFLAWDAWNPADEMDVLALQCWGKGLPNSFDDYVELHQINTDLRFWRLYKWMGTFNLWQITPDLESLAGHPPLNGKTPWAFKPLYEGVARLAPGYSKLVLKSEMFA